MTGVLFEFAKAVVDGVAVDIELLGGCLGGAIVVEPGLEGFEKDGSLFVGEAGEENSVQCSLRTMYVANTVCVN